MLRHFRSLTVLIVFGVTTSAFFLMQARSSEPAKTDPAIERARDTTRMLDDLYKTAVVLITEHYVEVDSDLPAGTAAIALFDAMKKKGWHEVRLLDATGQPIEEKNAPQDAFEKEAVAQLLAGKAWHEEIVERDGKRYLRAATPLPVVLAKCTMCHEHYKEAKAGEPIGALSYTLRIE
ncbi:MAG TPA: DUF3365 domain-containing protein [Pirellulales bacterium]|jgi:hypothetical protein